MKDVCDACGRTRALASDGRGAANGDRPDLCWALHDGEGAHGCLDLVDAEDLEDRHRAAMVRLVVATQWAVACALLDRVYLGPEGRHVDAAWTVHADVWSGQRVGALPCAVDVVADLLGAP